MKVYYIYMHIVYCLLSMCELFYIFVSYIQFTVQSVMSKLLRNGTVMRRLMRMRTYVKVNAIEVYFMHSCIMMYDLYLENSMCNVGKRMLLLVGIVYQFHAVIPEVSIRRLCNMVYQNYEF